VPENAPENEILVTLGVIGSNFAPDSQIIFDGVAQVTTFIDSQNLETTGTLDVGLVRSVPVMVTDSRVLTALQSRALLKYPRKQK
jgi:hypothetical protein